MYYRIVLLLICSLLFSCSDSNELLYGYWVDPKENTVAEFKNNKIIFTFHSGEKKQVIVDLERIDESRFHLESVGLGISSVLVIDWNTKTLSAPNIFEGKSDLVFVKAPNMNPSEILGTWYSYEKNGNIETSTIITQKKSSFDLDYITIDHKNKTYTKSVFLDSKFTFTNGFIFTDGEGDTYYQYYLTSYSSNTMNFTDSTGYKWSSHREKDPVHVPIPEDYLEEMF